MHFSQLLKTNTLRGSRERIAFTQAEVGALLGLSDDAIGNYESGRRALSLSTLLGLELVLGRRLQSIYPALARTVAEDLLPRLQELSVQIEAGSHPARDERLRAITEIGNRLSHHTPLA